MTDTQPLLPPLQRAPPDSSRSSLPPFPRKRVRQDDVISSDPPLFSSDDLPEAAENYASERPKRLRAGPWWTGTDGSKAIGERKRRKRGQFKRNLDSGVWMGTEGTEEGSEEELGDEVVQLGILSHNRAPPQNSLFSQLEGTAVEEEQWLKGSDDLREYANDYTQESAARIIQNCLEQGKEDVDLSCAKSIFLSSVVSDVETGIYLLKR
jgi:hypothetical protein